MANNNNGSRLFCCFSKRVILINEIDELLNNLNKILGKKLPVIWVMGPPQCAKSTISKMLAKSNKYELVKISSIIKNEANLQNWRGKTIRAYIKENRRIPDEMIVNLFKEAFCVNALNAKGYILDGFPKHLTQAKLFVRKICKPNIVLYLLQPLDDIVQRKGMSQKEYNEFMDRYEEAFALLNIVYRYYKRRSIRFLTSGSLQYRFNKLVARMTSKSYWLKHYVGLQ